jgi:hypothetical protein
VPGDGRSSRYRRLKRCWFDRTWFAAPASDPDRPHAFSNPRCGTSVLCRLWELFTLWHPSQFVPPLMALAGLAVEDVVDCCWSYEFKDKRTGKLVDLVMNVRPRDGDDVLIAVEAKYGKDKLKEAVKVGLPDRFPGAYLDLDGFRNEHSKLLVYLVHNHYAGDVRRQVIDPQNRHGVLTWEAIAGLQLELARRYLEQTESALVRRVVESIATVSRICPVRELSVAESNFPQSTVLSPDAALRRRKALDTFIESSTCFLAAQSGTLPDQIPFPYLKDEPSFRRIHELPKSAAQSTDEHHQPLWRLPPRHLTTA